MKTNQEIKKASNESKWKSKNKKLIKTNQENIPNTFKKNNKKTTKNNHNEIKNNSNNNKYYFF